MEAVSLQVSWSVPACCLLHGTVQLWENAGGRPGVPWGWPHPDPGGTGWWLAEGSPRQRRGHLSGQLRPPRIWGAWGGSSWGRGKEEMVCDDRQGLVWLWRTGGQRVDFQGNVFWGIFCMLVLCCLFCCGWPFILQARWKQEAIYGCMLFFF
jgi:hypothetical protein